MSGNTRKRKRTSTLEPSAANSYDADDEHTSVTSNSSYSVEQGKLFTLFTAVSTNSSHSGSLTTPEPSSPPPKRRKQTAASPTLPEGPHTHYEVESAEVSVSRRRELEKITGGAYLPRSARRAKQTSSSATSSTPNSFHQPHIVPPRRKMSHKSTTSKSKTASIPEKRGRRVPTSSKDDSSLDVVVISDEPGNEDSEKLATQNHMQPRYSKTISLSAPAVTSADSSDSSLADIPDLSSIVTHPSKISSDSESDIAVVAKDKLPFEDTSKSPVRSGVVQWEELGFGSRAPPHQSLRTCNLPYSQMKMSSSTTVLLNQMKVKRTMNPSRLSHTKTCTPCY